MEIVLHAILCADRAIEEKNGKKGLIGIFQNFGFPKFPAVPPPWYVYLSLGNLAKGEHVLMVNLIQDDTNAVIVKSEGRMQVRTPASDVEIILPIVGAAFRAPGDHWLTVTLDSVQVGSRLLRVSARTKPDTPGGGDT